MNKKFRNILIMAVLGVAFAVPVMAQLLGFSLRPIGSSGAIAHDVTLPPVF